MIEGLRRRVRHAAERLAGSKAPVILLYHHVAEPAADPWNLAVAPDRFEQQIAAISQAYDVVPLAELRSARRSRKPKAAITFDDGYRDVATVAAPILAKYDCAATLFLTTGAIGAPREFWWDELSRIVLESGYLGEIVYTIGGRLHQRVLPRSRRRRRRIHETIWATLAGLEEGERSDILLSLAAQTNTDLTPRPSHQVMNAGDVAGLKDTTIAVGAHTLTHPRLPELPPAAQRREIFQSRRDCEALTGEAPEAFAYPHGRYCERSAAAVREAGFSYGLTCEIDYVRARNDDALLPRFPTFDCGGTEMLLRLM